MTKYEVLARLRQLRQEKCNQALPIPHYLDACVEVMFEVAAEILEKK